MIVDCDTHFMPRDAFDHVGREFLDRRPILKFDETGLLADIDFPGEPSRVAGATRRLLSDRALHVRLSTQGREWARSLRWDDAVVQTEKVLQRVARGDASRAPRPA